MNYNNVFETIKKQYEQMFPWMQKITTQIDVIYQNTTALNTSYKKLLKRVARIEEKANIVSEKDE